MLLMQTAKSKTDIDNALIRVTTWTFRLGERTGEHVHQLPYVVVPLTSGTLVIQSDDAKASSDLAPGGCYFREAGVAHDVVNGGAEKLVFGEIEIKNVR